MVKWNVSYTVKIYFYHFGSNLLQDFQLLEQRQLLNRNVNYGEWGGGGVISFLGFSRLFILPSPRIRSIGKLCDGFTIGVDLKKKNFNCV